MSMNQAGAMARAGLRTGLLTGVVIAAGLAGGTIAMGRPTMDHIAADARPAVFADMTFDAALAANAGTKDKFLIVKATAVWCGPCKMMNATTWIADDVVAWVRKNGTAIELDVDKDQNSARTLKITAMPTMVAFKNGKELDRVVGYKSPQDLLAWFADVERGETGATRLEKKLAKIDSMGMQERMGLARELVQSGKLEQATEQYVWLWKNMTTREPAMYGVRLSFLANEIEQLASQHEPAKSAFVAIRDDLEPTVKFGDEGQPGRVEWLVLNNIVGDQARTLAWIDVARTTEEGWVDLRGVGYMIAPILQAQERWADMGKLIDDPMDLLKQARSEWRSMNATLQSSAGAMAATMIENNDHEYRDRIAGYYGQLLAAGREDEAKRYADRAAQIDPTPAGWMRLVEWALKVGQPRASHRGVLDAAAKEGGEVRALREQLDEALKAKGL